MYVYVCICTYICIYSLNTPVSDVNVFFDI